MAGREGRHRHAEGSLDHSSNDLHSEDGCPGQDAFLVRRFGFFVPGCFETRAFFFTAPFFAACLTRVLGLGTSFVLACFT
jgi:hypothetical protein